MKARQLYRTDQVRYGIYVIPPGDELYSLCSGLYDAGRRKGLLKECEVLHYIGYIYHTLRSSAFWIKYDYDNVQRLLHDNPEAWFVIREVLLQRGLPRYRSSNILGKRRKPDYVCLKIFRVRRRLKSLS